ncbi:beta-lactamase-like protein [Rhizophagus clarus]|uniref:Beta-lactamase-like protein n=1 Tax=Rhizophagus clarus TaxID=94130 RepID=A0A8H3M3L8_9GLOM|nr:beta-lactamase-like protein [Rhizophagus clarus]
MLILSPRDEDGAMFDNIFLRNLERIIRNVYSLGFQFRLVRLMMSLSPITERCSNIWVMMRIGRRQKMYLLDNPMPQQQAITITVCTYSRTDSSLQEKLILGIMRRICWSSIITYKCSNQFYYSIIFTESEYDCEETLLAFEASSSNDCYDRNYSLIAFLNGTLNIHNTTLLPQRKIILNQPKYVCEEFDVSKLNNGLTEQINR